MELAYKSISLDPHFEEITGTRRDEYQQDNLEQHFAVALWAEERFPPFGIKKEKKKNPISRDSWFLKEERTKNMEADLYYIGTPEK